MLTMISAWKLFWGVCEPGQVTVDCCAGRQAFFLCRWLACLTLPQDPTLLSEARMTMMALKAVSVLGPPKISHFPLG
jgi:hypothetical protein